MSQIKVTLLIDIPDNARVHTPDVDYLDEIPPEPPELMAVPPQVYDRDAIVPAASQGAPACPKGHGAMTRYPAGVNKAGKPYNASWRCDTAGCDTKPIWDKNAA